MVRLNVGSEKSKMNQCGAVWNMYFMRNKEGEARENKS